MVRFDDDDYYQALRAEFNNITQSVRPHSKTSWVVGGVLLIEEVDANAAHTWLDSMGKAYRVSSYADTQPEWEERFRDDFFGPESAIRLIYNIGRTRACFSIGQDVILKVRDWVPDAEAEVDTLRFVDGKTGGMPVPKVLFYHVDAAVKRSYMFMTRIPGKDLDDTWPGMSAEQQKAAAVDVADFIHVLSCTVPLDHDEYVTVNKKPLDDLMLRDGGQHIHPARGSYSAIWGEDPDDNRPVFYHADLGPLNVMVDTDSKKVSGIIDWEYAGFFPLAWIGTRPEVAANMCFPYMDLELELEEASRWRKMLAEELRKRGFPCYDKEFRVWFNKRRADRKAAEEALQKNSLKPR